MFIPIVKTREKYVASRQDFFRFSFELRSGPGNDGLLDRLFLIKHCEFKICALQSAFIKNKIEIINPI